MLIFFISARLTKYIKKKTQEFKSLTFELYYLSNLQNNVVSLQELPK
jgi:hypothetical protein